MGSLKVNRGTTYSIGLSYKKNDVASSLSGAVVRFTVKPVEFDADTGDTGAVIVKNVTDGDVNGQAEIKINPSDTATLAPGKYHYDIKVQEVSGDIYKVDEGIIKLDGSPTNRLV